eukprot:8349179-Prorocentrum_lima.AAC.1
MSRGARDLWPCCPAEVYHHLPDAVVQTLAEYFAWAFQQRDIPDVWTSTWSTLMPKAISPTEMKQLR